MITGLCYKMHGAIRIVRMTVLGCAKRTVMGLANDESL